MDPMFAPSISNLFPDRLGKYKFIHTVGFHKENRGPNENNLRIPDTCLANGAVTTFFRESHRPKSLTILVVGLAQLTQWT